MAQTELARLVTVRQASRLLGIGQRQLRRAIAEDELKVFDIGAWPRLRWSEVLAWVEAKRRPPLATTSPPAGRGRS